MPVVAWHLILRTLPDGFNHVAQALVRQRHHGGLSSPLRQRVKSFLLCSSFSYRLCSRGRSRRPIPTWPRAKLARLRLARCSHLILNVAQHKNKCIGGLEVRNLGRKHLAAGQPGTSPSRRTVSGLASNSLTVGVCWFLTAAQAVEGLLASPTASGWRGLLTTVHGSLICHGRKGMIRYKWAPEKRKHWSPRMALWRLWSTLRTSRKLSPRRIVIPPALWLSKC